MASPGNAGNWQCTRGGIIKPIVGSSTFSPHVSMIYHFYLEAPVQVEWEPPLPHLEILL